MQTSNKEIEELVTRSEELLKDFKIDRLLKTLNEKRLRKFKDARLYKIKGMAFRKVFNLKNIALNKARAIRAFNMAIGLKNNDPLLYGERAKTWLRFRQFKNALNDYNFAIKLNPKDSSLFAGRAAVLQRLKKYKEAKKDYSKAIRINPRDPLIYYGRSRMWYQLKNRVNQIKDLESALNFDPKGNAFNFLRLGNLYYEIKNYELAFEHYNKAIEINPDVLNGSLSYINVYIFRALSGVDISLRRKIYEACMPISDLLESISTINDDFDTDRYVVHFTNLPVADILLSDSNSKFRFYNVSYMNDPEEGKILPKIIGDDQIEEAFNRGSLNEESNCYVGSFLPETHADELVMWRTYGKDENYSEAKGCSIVLERAFFDKDFDAYNSNIASEKERYPTKKHATGKKPPIKKKYNKKGEQRVLYNPALHKVIYYDKARNDILGKNSHEILKAIKKLKINILKILSFRDSEESKNKINSILDSIVYNIITEVSYYFKSSDFSYENEERVILSIPPQNDMVKLDDNKGLPKRLYVESRIPIRGHIKKVFLGPRIAQPDRWVYLKAMMIKGNKKIQLIKSSCKFQ